MAKTTAVSMPKPEDLKKGIEALLPILKLLAARTANKYDDAVVAFLELYVAMPAESRAAVMDAAAAGGN